MRVPSCVIPILRDLQSSPLVAKGTPLEIWKAEDHRTWVASFTELGIALYNSDLPEEGLPEGYVLAAYLFDWEAQCQFDGWSALGNRSSTMPRVLSSFRAVGLDGEAEALDQAWSVWRATGGDTDATSSAYSGVRHEYSIDLDRLEYLACYFVDNADRLFYLAD